MWSHYFVVIFCISFSCFELARGNEHHPNGFSGSSTGDIDSYIRNFFNNSFVTKKPKSTNFNSDVITPPTPRRKLQYPDMNVTTNYYSTTSEDYPTLAEMEPLLRKFRRYFVKDVLPKPELGTRTLTEVDSYKYKHLCKNQVELITPREIKNSEGQKVQLANFPEYEQMIRAETCVSLDSTCEYGENFSQHLKPICKQNYIFRSLVTIRKDSNGEKTLQMEDIPIPSCCECYLFDTNM